MKYTHHLINGNHLHYEQLMPKNEIGRGIMMMPILSIIIVMLGFCIVLLPLAFTMDIWRSLYCMHLKLVRRLNKSIIRRMEHSARREIYIKTKKSA